MIAAVGVIMMLLLAALGFAVFYLAVRFIYFLPALAVEQRAAVAALKRSWQLTRGNVLRTFGYYLIASLLISLASYAVSLIGQLMWLPAISTSSGSYGYGPTAQLFEVLPGIIVTALLSFGLQVLALPFLTSYVTVMYADQLRRNDLVAGGGPLAGPPTSAPSVQPGAPYGAHGHWHTVNQFPWPPAPQAGPWEPGHPGGQWGPDGQRGSWAPGPDKQGGPWDQQPPPGWR